MKIHIGEIIKKRAKELRVGPTELAKAISTSKQNVYGIYKRESIDTGLLQKISKALNYDFFLLFVNKELVAPTEIVVTNIKKQYSTEESTYDVIKTQLMDLQEKYELLKKVNNLLEDKKKKD